MKGKQVERALAVILCITILLSYPKNSRAAGADMIKPRHDVEGQILGASVQIIMSVFQKPQAESQDSSGNKIVANGIGSLIEAGGEVLIVTHNHWGEALQKMSLVEFRDAENELLLRIFGFQFQALVRYQDKGTLILDIPEELEPHIPVGVGKSISRSGLTPAKLGQPDCVRQGAIVTVAYRAAGNREELSTLSAVVEKIDQYKGLPIYRLRSLNGQPILQGDSGGGIWFNGKLVGNMWASLAVGSQPVAGQSTGSSGSASLVFSDSSYAAILDIGEVE